MIFVNNAVFAITSASSLPVRIRLTAGSKRSRYFLKARSQMVKPGTTAASVRSAILATPLAVHAGIPKNGTNTPCGGVIFVSMRKIGRAAGRERDQLTVG